MCLGDLVVIWVGSAPGEAKNILSSFLLSQFFHPQSYILTESLRASRVLLTIVPFVKHAN